MPAVTTGRMLREGVRRVNRAPALLAGMFAVNVALALPLALTLGGMLAAHLGQSRAAETAASGVNYDWWQEFREQSSGLGKTFTPSIIGFAAVISNIRNILDNEEHYAAVAGAGIAFGLLWLFFAGGLIDRYARNRRVRAHGFFAASGVFFFRFLRLGLVAFAVYVVLFGYVHGWLFDRVYPWLTRDLAVERTDFLVRLFLYAVFGVLLVACNLVFDYAKIRAVVEDRRSMLGAIGASIRFIRRRPIATIRLYAACGLVFVVVLVLYAIVAPGAGSTGFSMWASLLLGQIFIVARLWTKLLFLAAQTVFFQESLAHAEYAAAPMAAWPDSPAVEALANRRL